MKHILTVMAALLFSSVLMARENTGVSTTPPPSSGKTAVGDCNASTAQIELNINNVRTTLLTGGDLWWDLGNARYEVPKVAIGSDETSKHSIFAGSLWIGGIDDAGQLKVAAQTYRQTGNDFWPGPLDDQGAISQEVCNEYDRFFEVLGTDIDAFRSLLDENGGEVSASQVPEGILKWPARGNDFADVDLPDDKNLAPFWNADADPDYDPTKGDYPVINSDIEGIYADQMIYWVFNDVGNIHTETNGEAIGLEIGALAFAFATNDEVNNMTFYKYAVDNRSTQPLDSVYFGQWVDPDLGEYDNDFVGCVPEEGLGIVYNGTAVDGVYGEDPPMLGVDFFQGPNKQVGIDDDGEPIYEELGMSAFVYYDNNFTVTGNPENASHFYGYLAGVWKDGTPFTCGGNGYGGTETGCAYIFPDDPSDNSPGAWSECSENNTPDDRRFLQASGPFRLEPGAFNEVIVGVVWVDGESLEYPCPSFDPILRADKKAQALFDSNFQLKDGPEAPNMSIRELDQELIISLWNPPGSNNENEAFEATDPILASNDLIEDTTYRFQGYKIYQLANAQVSAAEFGDTDKAREIAVVDVKDGVGRLINFSEDSQLGSFIPELMVDGSDQGIQHTFRITDDLFATGSKQLVNNRKYYFSVIAYSYNGHTQYDPNDPTDPTVNFEPYLEGRKNIKAYLGIPHKVSPQAGGVVLNAEYGDSPEVIQVEGFGSGGNELELTDESVAEILINGFAENPTYVGGSSPISVKVYDPYNVKGGDYTLRVPNVGTDNILDVNSTWTLESSDGTVYTSDQSIERANEQAIGGWQDGSLGFTVSLEQQNAPSNAAESVLDASDEFANVQSEWLTLVSDADGQSRNNWIRSGTFVLDDNTEYNDIAVSNNFYDPEQYYESILESKVAPYCLTNYRTSTGLAPGCGDCFSSSSAHTLNLDMMRSVDLVFSNNPDEWTRCVVVDSAPDPAVSEGKSEKNSIRRHASWNKDNTYSETSPGSLVEDAIYYVSGTSASNIQYTDEDGDLQTIPANEFFKANDITGSASYTANNGAVLLSGSDVGMSYFPGYAINVETGERLNIVFAENTFFGNQNGKDMIWNPTSTLTTPGAGTQVTGGEHFVYVMNSRYDSGASYQESLLEAEVSLSTTQYRNYKLDVYDDAMWTMVPYLTPGFEMASVDAGLVPSSAKVKIRVSTPYEQQDEETTTNVYQFNMDQFQATKGDTEVAASAMDLIKITPNPYYAFSSYETSQLDNRVRISNLPSRADVNIFLLDGTLIRTLQIDNGAEDTSAGGTLNSKRINSIDWDLKNGAGIPISSGIYLIHINAPDLGEETTLKWFCISRPIDLDVF